MVCKLPRREKILAPEAIWDDVCREEASLEVPQWHKDILEERERLFTEGKTRFIDWEDAKKQIKQAVQ